MCRLFNQMCVILLDGSVLRNLAPGVHFFHKRTIVRTAIVRTERENTLGRTVLDDTPLDPLHIEIVSVLEVHARCKEGLVIFL